MSRADFDADGAGELDDEGTLLLEQRFAIVPEWLLDADISDAALRLYAVLLRYGQTSGQRMPSRLLLATRMRKKSRDSVDRALKELVAIGAVVVQRRRQGPVNLTNRYVVRSSPPVPPDKGGRKSTATPVSDGGDRNSAARGSRTDAARVAAPSRPNPKHFTQKEPPPPTPSGGSGGGGGSGTTTTADDARSRHLASALDGHELDDVVAGCRDARQRFGLPVGRWTAWVLGDVLADAVAQGWPAADAVPALLAVARDSATRSPARLSCPGPWWDTTGGTAAAAGARSDDEAAELAQLETRLSEADGARVTAQRQARHQIAAAGECVTRLAVARRACALLDATPVDGKAS